MIWAVRQLLVPCNYLRIKQGTGLFHSKRVYDIVLPTALTAATVGLCGALSVPLEIAGHKGVTKSLTDLLALLIAFYMAALAAVSTFERKGIDNKLKGGDAVLYVLNHKTGNRDKKALSYRQFIAYLFGYLAFLSLILFMTLVFISSAWPKIEKQMATYKAWDKVATLALDPLMFVVLVFGVWQLFVTSLLGIYFLADRMQTLTDPQN